MLKIWPIILYRVRADDILIVIVSQEDLGRTFIWLVPVLLFDVVKVLAADLVAYHILWRLKKNSLNHILRGEKFILLRFTSGL